MQVKNCISEAASGLCKIPIDRQIFFVIIALACLVNLNEKFTFAKHRNSSFFEKTDGRLSYAGLCNRQ